MMSAEHTAAEILVRMVVEQSIASVKPSTLFESGFTLASGGLNAFGSHIDVSSRTRFKCAAIGKSAEAMALEVRRNIGDRVSGVVATPVEQHLKPEGFVHFKTGHPFPDETGVMAGQAIRDMIAGSSHEDVILFLVSGGGSASIFMPVEGVTLAEANRLMKLLFNNGVPIAKVNLVRRHLSQLGGGKLSALAQGMRSLSLVVSDVVGDDPSSIASGPTVADGTSPADAVRFLESSGLIELVPDSIPRSLMKKQVGFSGSTGGGGEVVVIASNHNALMAAEKAGVESGLNTLILSRFWESGADEAAAALISVARSIETDGFPVTPPALVLVGGETTVKVSGDGKGGRNQHLVLRALHELQRLKAEGTELNRTTIFSFGTDGKDGNSDDAGAYASLNNLKGGADDLEEIDAYLSRNDSNAFFGRYGGLISTGPTDTNVMDIFGVLVV